MKKQPEQTAQTRRNIAEAFWRLYETKSIEHITVRDVMALAGYNRGTFYEYFRDVYDVLDRIEETILNDCEDRLTHCTQVNMTFDDSREMVDVFIWLYEDNGKYLSVLLSENGDSHFAGKMKETVKPVFRNLIIFNGHLTSSEADYVLEYFLSALLGIMTYWFKAEKPLPIDELTRMIYAVTFDGAMRKYLGGAD